MTEIVQPPYAGQPLRASWAVAVSDGLNRHGMMGPSRMLVREFAGGCGFQPLPANNRWHVASGSMPPFVVRYVEQTESDPTIDYDGWEIYLPSGCVSVGSTCAPMNPTAYRLNANGERIEQPGWFRLPAPAVEGEDGDHWEVAVHAKCAAAITGVDSFAEWPKRYAWAEIRKSQRTQEEREEDENDVGDTFSAVVGTITFHGEDDHVSYCYQHTVKHPIMVRDAEASEPMTLFFSFSIDEEDLTLAADRIFVSNLAFSAAGATYVAERMHEIQKTDEAVYLKIDTNTTPYTAELKCFSTHSVDDQVWSVPDQVNQLKQLGEVWVLLYSLKHGHVSLNNLKALSNIQIYQ